MDKISIKKLLGKHIFSLSLLAGFFLCFFLFRIIRPEFSIFNFKEQYPFFSFFLLFIIILLPLAWLFLSESWKESDPVRKLLLLGLTTAILTTNYSFRTGILGIVFFSVCSLVFLFKEKKAYKPHVVYYLFALYFLIHLVSLIWTKDIGIGLKRLEVYIPFLVLPVMFCFFQLKKAEIDSILFVFYKGVVILVFLSLCCWVFQSAYYDIPLAEWLTLKKKYINFGERVLVYDVVFAWSNYHHPTYNGIGYLLGLSIAFYFSKTKSRYKVSLCELFIMIISCLLLVVITQSRTGILNFAIVMFFGIAYLLQGRKRTQVLYIISSVVAGAVLAFFFSHKFYDFIYDPARIQNIDTAIAYIKSNILLGSGVGGTGEIMDSHEFAQSLGYPFANVNLANPHNQFLGDAMQTGILGLITIILIVVYMFYTAIKQRNWLFFVFQLCFFQLMLIEMPLYLSKGIFYYLLFGCLFLQCKPKPFGIRKEHK